MDIREKLLPKWGEIVEADKIYRNNNIGTSLQFDLEKAIRPLLPDGIGYVFNFNTSGQTQHMFYELQNPENRIVV